MNTREYLSQVYQIDQRINSKIAQVEALRALAEKSVTTISDTPHNKTHNVHHMEDIIVEMVDLEVEINADIDNLVDLKEEIGALIQRVQSSKLRRLLELRYLYFRTWEQIAAELHRDIRGIYRMHNRALREIDAIRSSLR